MHECRELSILVCLSAFSQIHPKNYTVSGRSNKGGNSLNLSLSCLSVTAMMPIYIILSQNYLYKVYILCVLVLILLQLSGFIVLLV